MGFFSFIKSIFAGGGVDEEALDAARKRHGVVLTKQQKAIADKPTPQHETFGKDYDVWEEIDNYRWSFFIGGWAAKKIHPVGEDKVKRDLEKLEKKRQEEARKKGEG
jgi:hypothetical protein